MLILWKTFLTPCICRVCCAAWISHQMVALKEARVPFVSKSLVNYMYRRPSEIKLNSTESKLPLRTLAQKLGLNGALDRKKIGFSADIEATNSRFQEYAEFQEVVLETLKW